MKKTLAFMIFGLFMISMIGMVSAETLVAGIVYNEDHSAKIDSADITVTCNGHVKTTTSIGDGSYSVSYLEDGVEGCDAGDDVTVVAEKGDLYGSEPGVVQDKGDYPGVEINLAIINVTVPEFGLIIGVLTMMSAVGIFAFVRRQ